MKEPSAAVEPFRPAGSVTQRDCARWGALLFLASAVACAALYFGIAWLHRGDWLTRKLLSERYCFEILRSVLTALLPAAAFGACAGVLLFRSQAHGGKAHTVVAAAFALPVVVAFVDGLMTSRDALCLLGLSLFAPGYFLYWRNLNVNHATTGTCIAVALIMGLLFECYIGAKGAGGLHDKIAGAIFGSMWLGDALLARKVFAWSREGQLTAPASSRIQFGLGTLLLVTLCAAFYVWLVMTLFAYTIQR